MLSFDRQHDARVRLAAFEWLSQQVEQYSDVLPRAVLAQGFTLDAVRVPLVGPQGIFKPKVLSIPLSITTVPEGPYTDAFGPDDYLRYKYRGTDPNHADNRGLREAMARTLPLVYFHGIASNKYLAAWPVYVVDDEPSALSFTVAVDDPAHLKLLKSPEGLAVHDEANAIRRAYITSSVRTRLHQRAFRERVIEAYRRQCAFCRLRHEWKWIGVRS